jgi:acetoin utilization protein AcuB
MNPISLSVAQYMTPGPYVVGPKEPLGNARRLMEKYEIRHVPVWGEGKLVGVLSERDLELVWMLAHAPPESLTVEDAMTPNPYTVTPDTPLDEAVRVMAERKIGSAVVLEQGRIVGVFTSVDAMDALADVLEGRVATTDDRVRAPSLRSRRPARGRASR